MIQYIIKRLLQGIPLLIIISAVLFLLMMNVGDPIATMGGRTITRPEDRARFEDTTKCILCAACTTSCPVFWTDNQYFGPAAIVNAHRFIFDSRDEAAEVRLDILNDKEYHCRLEAFLSRFYPTVD